MLVTIVLLLSCVYVGSSTSLSRFRFAQHCEIELEQEFSDAEEGSVLWDCSRVLLAFVAESGEVLGQRILEIGSGTGAVGLSLARMGASSVIMTDKASQLSLMRRNVERNRPEPLSDIAPVRTELLTWGAKWKADAAYDIVQPNTFDMVVVCDCVYPSVSPEPLVHVLCELLDLNPQATILLACEYRAPTAQVEAGVDHVHDFFARMRASCSVSRVPDEEISPQWRCNEISLWRICVATAASQDST